MKVGIRKLIEICKNIANECADPYGYIPLRKIANICNCEIIIRKLLVEAIITTNKNIPDCWFVLINQEIHQVTEHDLEYESVVSPVDIRTRNTIAHEITHAIVIDNLGKSISDKGNNSDQIKTIERLVEALSPLLLVSNNFLLNALQEIDSIGDFLNLLEKLKNDFSISRKVLFAAFKTYFTVDKSEYLKFDFLLNHAIGIGEFANRRKCIVINKYQIIENFHRKPPSSNIAFFIRNNKYEWLIIEEVDTSYNTKIISLFNAEHNSSQNTIRIEVCSNYRDKNRKEFYFCICNS